jgi:hypothetical protein
MSVGLRAPTAPGSYSRLGVASLACPLATKRPSLATGEALGLLSGLEPVCSLRKPGSRFREGNLTSQPNQPECQLESRPADARLVEDDTNEVDQSTAGHGLRAPEGSARAPAAY